MSATPDSTLANPEQRIADLERQLAEARQQQAATADILEVINSSPGDLAPVFDAILEKAHTLCGAQRGALMAFDGQTFRACATRGMPEAFAEFLRHGFPALPQFLEPLARGEHVHIHDLAAFAAESPPETARQIQVALELAGTRTILAVPLRKDGRLLGYIAAFRLEVLQFTDKQITLLQNFAAQAVIAMENARLLTETREALEQQTATAEILRVIAGSTANVQPAFDAIAAAAVRLTGASLSGVVTYDGKLMHLAAMSGVSPEEDENIRAVFPIPADDGTATGRAILTRQVTHIKQMSASSEHTYPRLARSSGQTVLAVPMLRDGVPVGAINVQRRQAEPFTDKQIDLFKSFADQAVIAMENARLLTETREALEQQTATAEVLQVINSSPGDLAPVFDAILEKAHTLCGAAHGALMTYDGEFFRAAALHAMAEPLASWLPEPFRSAAGDVRERLLEGERLFHIPDITALEHSNPQAQAALDAGVRTLLIVPLRKDGTLLGYITANRREVRPFTEKQITLLENFAAQAVIAMENARLLTETREALEQQTATAEVLQVINSSPGDLAPVFDAILEKAHALCGAVFGGLAVFDG
jgi:GAF domain-containing protein